MRALIAGCLRLRFLVLLAALVFVVVGYRTASRSRVDVFPEFAPPRVEIQTEAPGLSAIEVETFVTTPIERAVHGVAFLHALRSKSVIGLSSVVLVFDDGTDLLGARQLVQERLARVTTELPTLARAPVMLSPLSSTSRVLKIGVSSKTLSQTELTDRARWTIRPRLMQVPGVANVAIWGERDRQLQVNVDPDALHARGVRLDDVTNAARDAIAPAPGGFVDTPTQRLPVMHVPVVVDEASLAAVPLPSRPPLRLGDVATVTEGNPSPIGDAVIDGAPGLLLVVEKQPWGNTLEVTRGVEAALAALAPGLEGVHVDPTLFRPATFVERALANLERSLAIGCVLVVAILVLFLYDMRTAIVSVVAIPLSLVAASLALALRGVTLDTMTIAGLVLALGEVVDDAIIDVENVMRRLQLERGKPEPRSAFHVVLEASLEVRSAVVYASLVVVLVFVPVFFLDGLAGAFFRPLAIAYVLAVAASLGVALTVTPALALVLLPRAALTPREGPVARVLRVHYARIVERAVRRPRLAWAAVGASLLIAAACLPFLGESFLPDFHETDLLMHWVGKPGTSLDEMRRVTIRASDELRAIPGVRNFGSHIGRAEVADEVVGPNFAELWISIDEADYATTVARVRAVVDGYPGLYRDVQTYLKERMKEVLTGASGSIVVRISGSDLTTLRARGDDVARALASVPGVTNLKVEPQALVPQIEVAVRLEAAATLGVSPGEVRRAVSTLVRGQRVGEVQRADRVVEVVVWSDAPIRSGVAALRELRVPRAGGGADVRLADVADVDVVPAPSVVVHDGASRKLDVTCDAAGRDVGAVARDVEARVRGLAFPPGHHAEVLGEHGARADARARLFGLAALSLLGIAFVLYADFRTFRLTAFVMGTLPLALTGGVVAVVLSGGVVSLGTLVGFVTVLGIAARNGIMLVSHFRRLETEEGVPFGPALVVRGAVERVVPITMTALATALALVPLVVASGSGSEIEHPLAIVIVGGLVTSTTLNLLVVPALYLRIHRTNREETSVVKDPPAIGQPTA